MTGLRHEEAGVGVELNSLEGESDGQGEGSGP